MGRDAPVGIALVLQGLLEFGGSMSDLFFSLPQYKMVKDKIQLPFKTDAKQIVNQLIDFSQSGEIDLTDGAKFLFEKSWVHVRASNTEPIIRIIAEAPVINEAQKLANRYKNHILGLV